MTLQPPVLTRQRVWLAYAVAVTADALQFAFGPLGFAFADEALDVAAMILEWRLIGFHPLLLPTFVLELVPLADLVPAWTACVAVVIALRRKQQGSLQQPPAPGPIIDV
jgi:hypothetical protein